MALKGHTSRRAQGGWEARANRARSGNVMAPGTHAVDQQQQERAQQPVQLGRQFQWPLVGVARIAWKWLGRFFALLWPWPWHGWRGGGDVESKDPVTQEGTAAQNQEDQLPLQADPDPDPVQKYQRDQEIQMAPATVASANGEDKDTLSPPEGSMEPVAVALVGTCSNPGHHCPECDKYWRPGTAPDFGICPHCKKDGKGKGKVQLRDGFSPIRNRGRMEADDDLQRAIIMSLLDPYQMPHQTGIGQTDLEGVDAVKRESVERLLAQGRNDIAELSAAGATGALVHRRQQMWAARIEEVQSSSTDGCATH